MHLSLDKNKRTLRDCWYWPLMARVWRRNKGTELITLPGSYPWDAMTAQSCLLIARPDMICVDKSPGVLAHFSRKFPGTFTISGDVFEVIENLGRLPVIGAIDLDLCGCASPAVIAGLKKILINPAIVDGCAVGITVCRRWKKSVQQIRMITRALTGPEGWAEEVGFKCYENHAVANAGRGSHMMTLVFRLNKR